MIQKESNKHYLTHNLHQSTLNSIKYYQKCLRGWPKIQEHNILARYSKTILTIIHTMIIILTSMLQLSEHSYTNNLELSIIYQEQFQVHHILVHQYLIIKIIPISSSQNNLYKMYLIILYLITINGKIQFQTGLI